MIDGEQKLKGKELDIAIEPQHIQFFFFFT